MPHLRGKALFYLNAPLIKGGVRNNKKRSGFQNAFIIVTYYYLK